MFQNFHLSFYEYTLGYQRQTPSHWDGFTIASRFANIPGSTTVGDSHARYWNGAQPRGAVCG